MFRDCRKASLVLSGVMLREVVKVPTSLLGLANAVMRIKHKQHYTPQCICRLCHAMALLRTKLP